MEIILPVVTDGRKQRHYIRLVQTKRATNGKRPDWSYWYCCVAENVSYT